MVKALSKFKINNNFKNKNFAKNILYFYCFFVCFTNINLFSTQLVQNVEERSEINNNNKTLNKNNYLIGPGDELNIIFLDTDEYSGEYNVLTDGTIQLPLIGSVDISYKTLEEARYLLIEKYKKELLIPDLYIKVSKSRPVLVSIIGETRRPGVYSLNYDDDSFFGSYPTVIDAIRKSGGISPRANLKEVILIRKINGEEGNLKKTKLNLLELMLEGDQSQNPYLFDGDIINLTMAASDQAVGVNINKSNINPPFIEVEVVGAVNSPGRIQVAPDTTLAKAIYSAGGPIEWRANTGNVQLIRIKNNGSASLESFKLNLNQDPSISKNPTLTNGDIINVKSNTISKVGQGLQVVTEPLSGVVTVFSLFKLLQ